MLPTLTTEPLTKMALAPLPAHMPALSSISLACMTSGLMAPASWMAWANSGTPITLPPGVSIATTMLRTRASARALSICSVACRVLMPPDTRMNRLALGAITPDSFNSATPPGKTSYSCCSCASGRPSRASMASRSSFSPRRCMA